VVKKVAGNVIASRTSLYDATNFHYGNFAFSWRYIRIGICHACTPWRNIYRSTLILGAYVSNGANLRLKAELEAGCSEDKGEEQRIETLNHMVKKYTFAFWDGEQ
jgi:hypothetical protein